MRSAAQRRSEHLSSREEHTVIDPEWKLNREKTLDSIIHAGRSRAGGKFCSGFRLPEVVCCFEVLPLANAGG